MPLAGLYCKYAGGSSARSISDDSEPASTDEAIASSAVEHGGLHSSRKVWYKSHEEGNPS